MKKSLKLLLATYLFMTSLSMAQTTRRRGAALLLVMGVMTVVSLIGVAAISLAQSGSRTALDVTGPWRAHYLAESGVQVARYLQMRDGGAWPDGGRTFRLQNGDFVHVAFRAERFHVAATSAPGGALQARARTMASLRPLTLAAAKVREFFFNTVGAEFALVDGTVQGSLRVPSLLSPHSEVFAAGKRVIAGDLALGPQASTSPATAYRRLNDTTVQGDVFVSVPGRRDVFHDVAGVVGGQPKFSVIGGNLYVFGDVIIEGMVIEGSVYATGSVYFLVNNLASPDAATAETNPATAFRSAASFDPGQFPGRGVRGDIHAGGNVYVRQGQVGGSIYAGGHVLVRGGTVGGDISAGASAVGNVSVLDPAGIPDGQQVRGNITASGTIFISSGNAVGASMARGNLWAAGNVESNAPRNVTLTGDAFAGGSRNDLDPSRVLVVAPDLRSPQAPVAPLEQPNAEGFVLSPRLTWDGAGYYSLGGFRNNTIIDQTTNRNPPLVDVVVTTMNGNNVTIAPGQYRRLHTSSAPAALNYYLKSGDYYFTFAAFGAPGVRSKVHIDLSKDDLPFNFYASGVQTGFVTRSVALAFSGVDLYIKFDDSGYHRVGDSQFTDLQWRQIARRLYWESHGGFSITNRALLWSNHPNSSLSGSMIWLGAPNSAGIPPEETRYFIGTVLARGENVALNIAGSGYTSGSLRLASRMFWVGAASALSNIISFDEELDASGQGLQLNYSLAEHAREQWREPPP